MRRILIAAIAVLAAGCGNTRTAPPDVETPLDPVGRQQTDMKPAGISFFSPRNWTGVTPQASLVAGIRSGTATLSIWRYPREEPLPKDAAALQAAKDRLVERVESKDPTFVLDDVEVRRRAITLVGRQTMAGRQVGVRSRHIFKHGAEVVVDAYARPEDFDRVDASVFQPLLRSLRVRRP